MSDETRPPRDDKPAIVRIFAALVVGGVLTLAGVVTGNPVLTVVGVAVLFITSNATRIWYVRGRRRR
jgi:hypothetical protein